MSSRHSHGPALRIAAICVVAGLIAAGCGNTATGSPRTGNPAGPSAPLVTGCLVAATWDAYAEERVSRWDEPGIRGRLDPAGGIYKYEDAKANPDWQAEQIDKFVADGARVILVRLQGTTEYALPPVTKSAIGRALAAGVPVIAYDHLIDLPGVLWIHLDEEEIGRLQARAVLAARPTGNYVIMRGPEGSTWGDRAASGIHEVLQPAIDRGDVKIVAEPRIDLWDPYDAQLAMTSILAANENKIDAVISESDQMNGSQFGVLAALTAAGLDGKVAIAGRGLDTFTLNEIARGRETVDVWEDPARLGTAAGDAAVALCRNPDIAGVKGATPHTSPGHNQILEITVAPPAITKDNLDLAIDSGWTTRLDLCRDVDPATAPPVCR